MPIVLSEITHPDYALRIQEWVKWRFCYIGGRLFIDNYLRKFTNRESCEDYESRRSITYNPAFAKAAIIDVKNSIYSRFHDITRAGGHPTYQACAAGLGRGVDNRGGSMNAFIGNTILQELLVMGRVGIYVDMPANNPYATLYDQRHNTPYCYCYRTENIRSYVKNESDPNQSYNAVLLEDIIYNYDEDTGFPSGSSTQWRYLWMEDGKVHVQFYDTNGTENGEEIILDMPRIPFVMLELSDSLMTDIADYQIALMNICSSDLAYVLKSNIPFYVEQYNPIQEQAFLAQDNGTGDGSSNSARTTDGMNVQIGITDGRRYPIQTERPGFISPPSEPLKVSMEKQEQLKRDIRLLLNLTINNLTPVRQAVDSKKADDRGLESGLSYIGLELEWGERQLAQIWADYMNAEPAEVTYPHNYNMRTDDDRRAEAKDILSMMDEVPSTTYRRELSKQVATTLLGCKIPSNVLKRIHDEIDKAPAVKADFQSVASDVEQGLVDVDTASLARGWPIGTAEKAKKDHAERLARIQEAQSAGNPDNAAARGVSDLSGSPKKDASVEKTASRDKTQSADTSSKVRGAGKNGGN